MGKSIGACKWQRWASRREGKGSRHGQVGQDGRWASEWAGLMAQARAVGGGSQAQVKPSGSAKASRVRVAYLVDRVRQTNDLN